MTREDMKRIVRQYVKETLERCEEDRADRTRITEDEREATYYGLSDAFDAASDQLRTNDLTAIAPTVDQLVLSAFLIWGLNRSSISRRRDDSLLPSIAIACVSWICET